MADQADVEAALAAIAANGIYPSGTAAASAVGAAVKIYRGWPVAPVLDADLAAGMAHVSVSATDAAAKNVTRYPRIWQNLTPATGTLTASVAGLEASFFWHMLSGVAGRGAGGWADLPIRCAGQ